MDLNLLKNYKGLTGKGDIKKQLNKVLEESIEVSAEIHQGNTKRAKEELLDLLTASLNLIYCLGEQQQNEEIFKNHLEKLDDYKKGKYLAEVLGFNKK